MAAHPSGLEVVTVPLVGLSASRQVWSRGGWLLGWSLAETSGAAPATLALLDGGSDSGSVLVVVNLVASASESVTPVLPGWPVTSGLFADVTGAIEGSLVIATVAD